MRIMYVTHQLIHSAAMPYRLLHLDMYIYLLYYVIENRDELNTIRKRINLYTEIRSKIYITK